MLAYLPLCATALDLAVGDPPSWGHPVRLIGGLLGRLACRAKALPDGLKRPCGVVVTAGLGLAVYSAVYLLCALPWAGWAFSLYFAFAGLALGQLIREAASVAGLIESSRLEPARSALSHLVSRDTGCLDESGLWRTLAETVSENFNDAFVAPFMWLCLGGPPLLWLYKTVSTMDSMWGYKTPEYRDLGWACARADDLLAFVPARLSALAMIGAGWLMGLPAGQALARTRTEARTMASPNAGWPMAAAAWLCGGAMGGEAVYFGTTVQKPPLGPGDGVWDRERFSRLRGLVLAAGAGLVLAGQAAVLAYARILA